MKKSLRYAVAGVALFGLTGIAHGADLDVLRGSQVFAPSNPVYADWSGFYVGGQVGYGNTNADFTGAATGTVERLLRDTALEGLTPALAFHLGPADSRDTTYGAFMGYNSQWESVVLGLEANYTRASITATSSDSMRVLYDTGARLYNIDVETSASILMSDYGTLRARAGYVMGRFMPYAMLGVALGRFETSRHAEVFGVSAPQPNLAPVTPFFLSTTEPKTVYALGYAAGGGVDVALLPCLFLRAEFEWVQFSDIADAKFNLATGRVAAAYKF